MVTIPPIKMVMTGGWFIDVYYCFAHIYILLGGLEHESYDFPYIGNVIIPTDFHIFQRGRSTTNQYITMVDILE